MLGTMARTTPSSSLKLLTRSLASHAYCPPPLRFSSPPSPQPPISSSASTTTTSTSSSSTSYPESATSEIPELSPEEQKLLHSVIRVDHAGELGANWIYRGQKWASAIRGDRETVKQVEEMWDNERHHLATLTKVIAQHKVRPTALYPLWQGLAWGLGAGTAIMGKEAAMACTEAVETVIGEHYDDQLRALKPVIEKSGHPSLKLLASIVEEFRDDELEHLDTAVQEGALKAPGHALLSAIVGFGCKAAIKVCERV